MIEAAKVVGRAAYLASWKRQPHKGKHFARMCSSLVMDLLLKERPLGIMEWIAGLRHMHKVRTGQNSVCVSVPVFFNKSKTHTCIYVNYRNDLC